jgi:hypothetical protein
MYITYERKGKKYWTKKKERRKIKKKREPVGSAHIGEVRGPAPGRPVARLVAMEPAKFGYNSFFNLRKVGHIFAPAAQQLIRFAKSRAPSGDRWLPSGTSDQSYVLLPPDVTAVDGFQWPSVWSLGHVPFPDRFTCISIYSNPILTRFLFKSVRTTHPRLHFAQGSQVLVPAPPVPA